MLQTRCCENLPGRKQLNVDGENILQARLLAGGFSTARKMLEELANLSQ